MVDAGTVRKDFPVWRELKLSERGRARFGRFGHVRKDFPVWRELKQSFFIFLKTNFLVRKDFPVWRELKLVVPAGTSLMIPSLVRKDFPVWRELKPGYVFHAWKLFHFRPKGLSRLKGIETRRLYSWPTPFSGESERTFPFEGNWNAITVANKKNIIPVRKDFPVWRELKPIL